MKVDESRRKAQEEENPSYEQKHTCQDGGSGEEMPREQENLEKCNHASGGEELIGCGPEEEDMDYNTSKLGSGQRAGKGGEGSGTGISANDRAAAPQILTDMLMSFRDSQHVHLHITIGRERCCERHPLRIIPKSRA